MHRVNKQVTQFISKATLDEFRDVIFRPNILSKLPDFTTEQIETFIEDILSISTTQKNISTKFKFARDPKDEKYINLAIEVGADFLVTRDHDLLSLLTAHTDEAKEFRQKFRHLRIVDPVEFLRIVREKDLSLNP